MSKTFSEQMSKARTLIEGLRKNPEWATQHNIKADDLNTLIGVIEEGERLSTEADALREKTHQAVVAANEKLYAVKDKMQTWKLEVKRNVDISKWPEFGVMDKR